MEAVFIFVINFVTYIVMNLVYLLPTAIDVGSMCSKNKVFFWHLGLKEFDEMMEKEESSE